MAAAPLLELRGVSKAYPGVLALDRVDLELRAGEVHVLFGENGAGKSTLISLVAGVQAPDAGEIRLAGTAVRFASVHEARRAGVSAVFQEFSLVPQLTVAENIVLGDEPRRGLLLDVAAARRIARELLDRLGFALDPDARVEGLTRAEQQMVEIAKAFRSKPRVLVLDEPTASLTEREARRLLALVEQLEAQGVGILYITHRMGEIRRIGDRVTVLRDGRKIATVPATTSEDELVRLMTGRTIEQIFPPLPPVPAGAPVLRVEDLTTRSGSVVAASFALRAGEILGFAGLVGSGKSEAARAVFGLEPITSGRLLLDGAPVETPTPAAMLARGVLYLPPDRREEGLAMVRPARENMTMAALDRPELGPGPWLGPFREARLAHELARRIELRPAAPERAVELFSGGNQQKILFARALARPVRLLMLDEPTVGVDMATRAAIYRLLVELAERGTAILLVSSDLPEILHLSHRVLVFHRGRVRAELVGAEIGEEAVLQHFFEREAA